MKYMSEKEKRQNEILDKHLTRIKVRNRRIVCIIVLSCILAYAIFRFFFTVGKVPTGSMVPTLEIGTNILIDNMAYRKSDPERGDVLCFKKDGELVTKRVIGMPGERVQIKEGKVFINGHELMEVYLSDEVKESGTYGNIDIIVPTDSYYVLGDNRGASNDSRFWARPCVNKKDIVGRVFASFKLLRLFSTYHEIPVYESEEIPNE